jgi:pyridoxal phosphate enzyme (YggS family)
VSIDAAAVAPRLTAVEQRIQGASGGRRVEIVAVTKGFGVEAVLAALELGLTAIGENYAQELLAKVAELPALDPGVGPRWHFLGRLQRNKVRHLVGIVDVWESVDRVELLDEIARRAPGARVLVQANLSGEAQKGGARLDEVAALVAHGRQLALEVTGLMGVAPAGPPEGARAGFRALVGLADELSLEQRSIGMSNDLEVAVQEGATAVRVGRDLFGPRPAPGPSAV